jgi:hypothetical protein
VKRSQSVRLVLVGGLSAGAWTACAPTTTVPRVTTDSVYVNDYHLPGAGYYHAPFQAFYPQPYNFYDPQRKQYFYGGQWGPAPHRSIVNISAPTAAAVLAAEAARTDVPRGGFGSTSRGHSSRFISS